MRIYGDILSALKIEQVLLFKDGDAFACAVIEISGKDWNFNSDSPFLSGEGKIRIRFNGNRLAFRAEIKQDRSEESGNGGGFSYSAKFLELVEGEKEDEEALFEGVSNMEGRVSEWDKRHEERYEIGLDEQKISALGLKRADQIVSDGRFQYPCVLNDISFSGAKITTDAKSFKKGSGACLSLSFVRPIECISIMAEAVASRVLPAGESKVVSVVSLHFLNPVPIEYKERLSNFIETFKEGEK